jgi:hypothetical protein
MPEIKATAEGAAFIREQLQKRVEAAERDQLPLMGSPTSVQPKPTSKD